MTVDFFTVRGKGGGSECPGPHPPSLHDPQVPCICGQIGGDDEWEGKTWNRALTQDEIEAEMDKRRIGGDDE